MPDEPCAWFVPASGPDTLAMFQIRRSDGKVNIGRGMYGMKSLIVSRNLGAVWIDDAGIVRFDKVARGAMFVVKGKSFLRLELGISVIDSGLSRVNKALPPPACPVRPSLYCVL